jgi:glycosyltransferase involved in cell wall biosynthesis
MAFRLSLAHWLRPASLVNQHSRSTPALARWACRHRIPFVYTEQVTAGDDDLAVWEPVKDYLKIARQVTAVSEAAAECLTQLLGMPPARITVVPNMVDFEADQRGRSWPELAPGACPIVFVGRLHPMKGVPTLIEAAAMLKESGHQPEVRIVGDGPERAALLAQVQARGLECEVRLLPAQQHDSLPPLYRQAGIFVMPSVSHEGLGLVVLEAMSFGLPIVASDHPAFRDVVIHGENGLIFPRGEARALAEALAYLLERPAERQRLGRASRRKYESGEFTPERVAEKYLMVYQRALVPATGDHSIPREAR